MKTLTDQEKNKMFGNYLYEMRKQRGLTQEKLANNICDPRQIYRYEKGRSLPSAQKMFLMSERLGVDLMNFFEQFEINNYRMLSELKQKIEVCFYKNDFKTPLNLIKELDDKLEYLTDKNIQYYLWVKSSCLYRTGDNYDEVIKNINKALNKTYIKEVKTLTTQEVNLLNLKAIILMENNQDDHAVEIWNLILDKTDLTFSDELEKLLPKIFYNLSYIYRKNKQFDLAISFSQKGIDYCINQGILLGLAYLYYNNGLSKLASNRKDEGIESIIRTFQLLKIENNTNVIKLFRTGLKEDFDLNIDDYLSCKKGYTTS
ncbi:helix-turn-helix domain-containing protein [Haloplasma contractile]|uniref:Transcriptional repressor rstR protein n=1 Tax=Haloplasma contractile SSD-17B TaxID=1033810 RepID=F7PWZ6_9MOLU|nr:helix-turn-helix domain-containing protein [Haloplasma contractile]ERJ12765.1 Transcriptional repressor rstR protein [Haloplasma contractile SSD-17B]